MKVETRRGGFFRMAGAFTLGAALGSVLALLYAPASGKVTRKRLAKKAIELRRACSRRLGQTGRALVTGALQVREAAGEWISEHIPHGNGRHTIRHRRVRHAAIH